MANNRTTGGGPNGSDDQQFDARPKGLRFDHDMIVEDKFHTGTKWLKVFSGCDKNNLRISD